MSRKIRTEAVDSLFDAVLSLKSREECYTFFEDVCTINELLSLSQRFEVAKMLRDQKTYMEIAEKTYRHRKELVVTAIAKHIIVKRNEFQNLKSVPFFILLKKANAFIFSYPALEVRPPFFQSVAFSHTHQN